MIRRTSTLFFNREHAAQQLISKLSNYKNKNCCIIATSNGGVVVGSHVAKGLNADLVFIPSEKIADPGDSQKSIGIVSLDYAVTRDLERDIPQDFLYRRTRAIRSELLSRYQNVYSPISSKFQDRIVIMIDDCLQTTDEILGCLKAVRKQHPEKIVVAAPVVSHSAAHAIGLEADISIFVHVVSESAIETAYFAFDTISDDDVLGFINLPIKQELASLFENEISQAEEL
jgi:putative phosphoribosyl transferase